MLVNSNNFQQRKINTRRKQENPSTISLCKAPTEICLLQVEPLGTTNFLPRCCWDPRTVVEKQHFQLCRLAQRFKQICGALCSLRFFVEAPAVFCQNQSLESMLGRWLSRGIHSILNAPQSTPTPMTTSQISPLPNFTNRCRKQENLQQHPSTISLFEAPCEICLLQD